jgi:gamma-glutamylcyclotransferase (GGCT)/AIG2-like uncharacterized protein YtfP
MAASTSPTDPATDALFVYGTLRRGSAHPMARWLAWRTRWLGEAALPGALYDCGSFPAAVHDETAATSVIGEMVALGAGAPATLARLDAYEGCAKNGGLYLRIVAEAAAGPGGATRPVFAYVLSAPPRGMRRIQGGDWLAHLAARRPVVRISPSL